jgi:uncharacterized coiled-coil DUF342 family protein
MNNERRKAIAAIRGEVEELRDRIQSIVSQITDLKDEEQEYFDNMPESFQEGEKGQAAEQAVNDLYNAESELEGFDLDVIINYLEEAAV